MAEKESVSSQIDISQLRTPIQISGKPIEQVLNSIHYGSPELRCLLMDECDLIFECKVCRALFRDLPNFISHKRVYCLKSSTENRYVTIASLPEEKIVVIHPQAPEETEQVLPAKVIAQQTRPTRAKLEETISRIQSGELGKSHAYQVYTEAAEKLQRQKEGMKVATIRTTPIPTNKNAVFIDVNMTSVNIHERQQVSSSLPASYDQSRNDPVSLNRKTGDRLGNTKNVRKSVRQEKHATEPQKLLMEHLKEIQHKVKQKVAAAQDKAVQQKKSKNTQETDGCGNDISSMLASPSLQKVAANSSLAQRKTAVSSSPKTYETLKSVLSQDDKAARYKKGESDFKEVTLDSDNQRTESKIQQTTAKESKSHTTNAVIAVKNRKKFATRTPICMKCDSVFATRKSLGFHMKIHHSPKRTFYPCPYCSSVFYYFFGITRHLFRNHSKTLEEVNAMRKQLREGSYTKQINLPSLKNETDIPAGTHRSARILKRNLMTETSQETSNTDKKQQQPKITDGVSKIIAFDSSVKNVKMEDFKNQSLTSQKSLSSSVDKKSDNVDNIELNNSKEKAAESLSVKLKPRQQQGSMERKQNKINNFVITRSGGKVGTPTKSLLSTASTYNDSTSYECYKCRRAFRRKISLKNHQIVCKGKGASTKKLVRSQNTRREITSEPPLNNKPVSVSPMNSNPAKSRSKERTNSNDSLVKTVGDSQSASPGKIAQKKDTDTFKDHDKKIEGAAFRNIQDPLIRTSCVTRRSSSVDRVKEKEHSRGRSHVRNSASRDERDSSVESTQSNMEGKSPRSRRNVLSRYAKPVPLRKSPAKFDLPLKSNTIHGGDSSSSVLDMQLFEANEKSSEKRGIAREELAENVSGNKIYKSENEVAGEPTKGGLHLPEKQDRTKIRKTLAWESISQDVQAAKSEICAPREINKGNNLSQKSLRSENNSAKNQQESCKSDMSPRRQPSNNITSKIQNKSTGHSGLLQKILQDSSPKSEIAPSKLESSGKESAQSKPTTIVKSECLEEKTEANIENNLKQQQETRLDSEDSKDQIVTETFKDFSSQKQEANENLADILPLESDNKIDMPATILTKQNNPSLDVSESEIGQKNINISCLESPSNSSNLKGNSPVTLTQKMVVCALAERPKRKRKVPSRNSDAEEMLSKIHSHNRETFPGKRRKLNLGIIPTDALEEKGNYDITVSDSLSLDENCDHENKRKKENKNGKDEKDSSDNNAELQPESNSSESSDENESDHEELGRRKGRFVSNRMYVLEKLGTKRKRLKCFDQVKVLKLINEDTLKCLECGETCSHVFNLRRHVIRQHLKWTRFKCKLCKFESYDRSECSTHLIRGHRNRTGSLKNVNHYIIDLVKQGAHARSLKKNETIKVKQESESREGNIYARPTVKKLIRLPQRANGETKNRPERGRNSGSLNSDQSELQEQSTIRELMRPQSSVSVQPCSSSSFSNQVTGDYTTSNQQPDLLVLNSKAENILKQISQPQLSPKPGLDSAVEGKDISLKVSRRSLPFNISTRNSPRTFDTRPYNPEDDDASAKIDKQESSFTPKQKFLGMIASGSDNVPKQVDPESGSNHNERKTPQNLTKSAKPIVNVKSAELSRTDSSKKSINIFDKGKLSCSFSSSNTGKLSCGGSISIPLGSRKSEVASANISGENSAPRLAAVNLEGDRKNTDIQDKLEASLILNPSSKPTTVNVESSKTKVISYIIRGPQQKLPLSSDETITAEQLAKTWMKLKEFGSPTSATASHQVQKTPLAAPKLPSTLAAGNTNRQRRQTVIPVSSAGMVKTSIEQLKQSAPKRVVIPKETIASSSGVTLTAAIAKGGQISTTAATSFLLSQGQAGKFIIYTRPAGAKDLTTVGSVSKPISVASTSSTTSLTSVSKPSDASQQKDSGTSPSSSEDHFSSGTFVIRKHYL